MLIPATQPPLKAEWHNQNTLPGHVRAQISLNCALLPCLPRTEITQNLSGKNVYSFHSPPTPSHYTIEGGKYFSFRHPVKPFQALRWNENISLLPPQVKSWRKRRDKKTNLNKLLIREVISSSGVRLNAYRIGIVPTLPLIIRRLLGMVSFDKLRIQRRLTATWKVSAEREGSAVASGSWRQSHD